MKSTPSNNRKTTRIQVAFLALAAMLCMVAPGQAALDVEYTTLITDLTDFFTSIKGLVTSVVVFGIVIGYLKLTKKK